MYLSPLRRADLLHFAVMSGAARYALVADLRRRVSRMIICLLELDLIKPGFQKRGGSSCRMPLGSNSLTHNQVRQALGGVTCCISQCDGRRSVLDYRFPSYLRYAPTGARGVYLPPCTVDPASRAPRNTTQTLWEVPLLEPIWISSL